MSRVVSYSDIGTPSRVTEPSLGVYKPASSFIMVLLPHPEAPTMAHVSPSSNVRLYGPIGWMYSSTVNLYDTLSRHSLPAFGGALPGFSSGASMRPMM